MRAKRLRRFIRLAISVAALLSLFAVFYEPDLSRAELVGYQNAASRFINIDGQSVHYRREGNPEKPALLLIHGTASSLHTWDGWVTALEADFDLVRLDLPAFGLTGPAPDRDYRITRYVALVDAFATSLELDYFAIAGNSLGGHIAWQYTLTHPAKVQAQILIDPSGFIDPDDEPPLAFKLARTPIVNRVMPLFAPRRLYEKSVYDVYGDDSKVTETLIDRYFNLSLFEGNRQAFVDRALQSERPPVERLTEIQTPTLILWGEDDLWIPVKDATKFAAAINESELIIYPGAGHVPMEEIPVITANDARRFLTAQQGADQ
ncbi:MAG: alpha/beta fold hydrolase [Woeseiaceae bacterium]